MDLDTKTSISTYLIIFIILISIMYWVDKEYRSAMEANSDLTLLFEGDTVQSFNQIKVSDFDLSEDKLIVRINETIQQTHLKKGHELFVHKANDENEPTKTHIIF